MERVPQPPRTVQVTTAPRRFFRRPESLKPYSGIPSEKELFLACGVERIFVPTPWDR